MTITLDHLTLDQLASLIDAAERRLEHLSLRRPTSVVRPELHGLATSEGYLLERLFDATPAAHTVRKPVKRKKAKVAPKYQNPDDKRQTWTGRGSAPRWLAEKVKRGQSATDFLLPGMARPTPKKGSAVVRKSVFKRR